jgi:hypothetical protein
MCASGFDPRGLVNTPMAAQSPRRYASSAHGIPSAHTKRYPVVDGHLPETRADHLCVLHDNTILVQGIPCALDGNGEAFNEVSSTVNVFLSRAGLCYLGKKMLER